MQRSFRPTGPLMQPSSELQSGSLLRRLRDDPQDSINRIAGEIGPRRATSLAEAQTAAYIDGRLRRAGLRVSAEAFRAPTGIGWDGWLTTALAWLSALLYYWLPIPSLALACWNLGAALVGLWRPAAPLLQRKRPSQNVIATRALNSVPRWRVVLLAPLDAPPASGRLARTLTAGGRLLSGRGIACGLIALLGAGAFFGPIELRRALWYLQFAPACYLLLASALELQLARAPATAGAANHAAALAALLQSVDMLAALKQTELWAVALGAHDSGAGLADLMRRYPFDSSTMFVALESLGSGRLSYVTRDGVLPQVHADPLLLRLVAEAEAADPLIDAEPRRYTSEPALARPLRRAGKRTLTLIGVDGDGNPALRGSPHDTPDQVDEQALDRAIRLVVGLVKKIDEQQ